MANLDRPKLSKKHPLYIQKWKILHTVTVLGCSHGSADSRRDLEGLRGSAGNPAGLVVNDHYYRFNLSRGLVTWSDDESRSMECPELWSDGKQNKNRTNTRYWPNVGSMLGQRRRRWANVKPTLCQHLMLAWNNLLTPFTSNFFHTFYYFPHMWAGPNSSRL